MGLIMVSAFDALWADYWFKHYGPSMWSTLNVVCAHYESTHYETIMSPCEPSMGSNLMYPLWVQPLMSSVPIMASNIMVPGSIVTSLWSHIRSNIIIAIFEAPHPSILVVKVHILTSSYALHV